jgi:hypothetical protein
MVISSEGGSKRKGSHTHGMAEYLATRRSVSGSVAEDEFVLRRAFKHRTALNQRCASFSFAENHSTLISLHFKLNLQ